MNTPPEIVDGIVLQSRDYRFGIIGKVVQWSNDGYGFIYSYSSRRKYYAHVSGRIGKSKVARLVKRNCMFVVGLDPNHYRKGDTAYSAIAWVLEDDLDLAEYAKARTEYLTESSNINDLIKANWYLDVWNKISKCAPKKKLVIDKQLNEAIERHERSVQTAIAFKDWLKHKSQSPYFAISLTGREKIIQDGWLSVQDRADKFFKGFPAKDFLRMCREYNLPTEFRIRVLSYLLKNESLAIDLESDGTNIFQFGYATESGSQLFTKSSSNYVDEISSAETLSAANAYRLVGHNVTDWDLPILRARKRNAFFKIPIWDTLLASWFLEPWKNIHALHNPHHAHRADSDAQAALDLFFEQLKRLPFSALERMVENTRGLAEILGDPEVRKDINRTYPGIPPYLRNQEGSEGLVIMPQWRLHDVAWCGGVTYEYPDSSVNVDDLLINPKSLGSLSDHNSNIILKVLYWVVSDAYEHNVQVLLRMIPSWLRSRVEDNLKESGCLVRRIRNDHSKLRVTTFAAYRDEKTETIRRVLASPENAVFFLEDGRIDLAKTPKTLRSHEISRIKMNYSNDAFTLFSVSNASVGQRLGESDSADINQLWLTYDPANRKIAETSCWHLWQSPPFLASSSSTDKNDESAAVDKLVPVVFPTYVIERARKFRFKKDFIPPTSANRLQYWKDALSRFLSFGHEYAFKGIYILLTAHSHESHAVEQALSECGLTLQSAGGALRQLEAIQRKGHRFAVDVITNAKKWLDAAEYLGAEIRLVFETLPLHEWRMYLHYGRGDAFENITADARPVDIRDEDGDIDCDSADSDIIKEHPICEDNVIHGSDVSPIIFSQDMAQICTERYLHQWLMMNLKGSIPKYPPIILDSRFDNMTFGESSGAARQDFVFAPIENKEVEILEKALLNAFGGIEREEAPQDYDTYRNFLRVHWGYDDFKPDTQLPVIKAIIPNDSDVLVRLPTGEGKSVLFQVSALVRGMKTQRLTLVITPLRALMADQVRALWEKGFYQSVDYLSGDRDPWVTTEVYQGVIDGRIKLLYVAPERFRVQRFRDALSRRLESDERFEYIVVDEAHCISQWGFEFRPDYLYAMSELRKLGRTSSNFSHVLLFSATVTDAVRKDIEREAGIDREHYKILPEKMLHPIQPFIRLHAQDVQSRLYGADITIARQGFIEHIIRNADCRTSAVVIFVSRRKHAEELSQLLNRSVNEGSLPKSVEVRHFHAGLPALERQEVYGEFRDRKINVLACTKAFGMGMDIPHIHWCVHLAPPATLEDYLQEVGRTGRGKQDRLAAGINNVDCHLLYDQSDFDTNHSKVMSSRISLPAIVRLWDSLCNETLKSAHSGQDICIIPTDKHAGFQKDALRGALFWLERSGRLDILGYLYGLIRVRINKELLKQAATGDSELSKVARAILEIYRSPSLTAERPSSFRFFLDSALDYVSGFVGILFGRRDKDMITSAVEAMPGAEGFADEAEIHVQSIWRNTDLRRIDDVYLALRELQKRGVLECVRVIEFSINTNLKERQALWQWMRLIVSRITVATMDIGRDINVNEIDDWFKEDAQWGTGLNWSEQRSRTARRRVVQSAIALCAAASLRIHERYDEQQQVLYSYNLSKNRENPVKRIIGQIQGIAENIANLLARRSQINLSELFDCCGDKVDIWKLNAALRLLANLGICASKQDLMHRSYIIELKNNAAINPDAPNGKDAEISLELEQCNQMALLRSYAMELYALLPDDMRTEFIDDYFTVGQPDDLLALLELTVGSIDEEIIASNDYLSNLLARVRQEAMAKALDRLDEDQRDICESPYYRTVLVNAGPGAGKTHVLMMRCAHLIHRQGLKPEEILVLAFNRAVVHEIRERIIKLFTELGYGAYVKRLQVYTFHAFARRHMSLSLDESNDTLREVLSAFAEKMRDDPLFGAQIAGGYRVILVDEFQDMNEDFYSVICSLQRHSNAAVMAIGDDDQDILLWNRLEEGQTEKLHASWYFDAFQNQMQAELKYLRFNYRSLAQIVERSQSFISRVIDSAAENKRFKHTITLKSAREPSTDNVIAQNSDFYAFLKALPVYLEKGHTVAILCRTNYEVYEIARNIRNSGIENGKAVIQTSNRIHLSSLRDINEWLEICRARMGDATTQLSDDLYRQLMTCYRSLGLPDGGDERTIEQLWRFTHTQYHNPTLIMHVEFIEDLYTDDYDRIVRRHQIEAEEGKIIVSTIHKVKGLEFDIVWIKASDSNFPLTSNSDITLNDFSAEEARLYYVAMTRAKNQLHFAWSEREKAWHARKKYEGKVAHAILEGKPEEVYISWPGLTSQYDAGLQSYLRVSVAKGDQVSVKEGAIYHDGRKIGQLASSEKVRNFSDCRISAIMKYAVNERLQKKYPMIYDQIHPILREQGWLYTALINVVYDLPPEFVPHSELEFRR